MLRERAVGRGALAAPSEKVVRRATCGEEVAAFAVIARTSESACRVSDVMRGRSRRSADAPQDRRHSNLEDHFHGLQGC